MDRKVQFPNVLDERIEHKSFSLYEVSNETIKSCDEVDVSLYQRWMTDVSFVEEEWWGRLRLNFQDNINVTITISKMLYGSTLLTCLCFRQLNNDHILSFKVQYT